MVLQLPTMELQLQCVVDLEGEADQDNQACVKEFLVM